MNAFLGRVTVVGGGPGGAFFARLLRLARPATEVRLVETLPPLQTFGFGVGLSISTQQNLGRSDPETFDRIFGAAHRGHGMRLVADGGSTRMPGNDQVAIARAELLQILYEQAAAAGVHIETGVSVDSSLPEADVVVAADGVGSRIRQDRVLELGASVRVGRQRYIWCGTDNALPDALFAPVRTEFGTFVAHAYPYAKDRSTFLVETDEATWRAAGFEHTSDGLPVGETDETSRSFLEAVFAGHLGGGQLLGNNSRWTQFKTVSCARWSDDNVVLLGDAAHTAHYSVGSGTKLARVAANARAGALARCSCPPDAFAAYESERKPGVARLQHLAERSQVWWEGYVRRLGMSPERLLVSFLTRAGNVSIQDLRDRQPDLARTALSQYSDETPPDTAVNEWVIARPLATAARSVPSRDASQARVPLAQVRCALPDPWSAETDAFLAETSARVGAHDGIELTGPPDRLSLLERLDVAERLVQETGLLVSVRGPAEFAGDLAAGLVAGRTHLVSFADGDGAVVPPVARSERGAPPDGHHTPLEESA